MLDSYGTTRDELIRTFEALNDLAARRSAHRVLVSSSAAKKRLEENRFNLVVFGEFKRGKSTFINALLGRRILPTAVVPLTSIITLVRYGDPEHATIHFRDGNSQDVAVTDLPAYITESGNPENRKLVARVDVFEPSPLLRDGLQIIDTPGVGSVYEHNTEVALEFLPNADAAVFLIAADPPISKSEREFLATVKQYVQRVFFVQNKADRLSREELSESMQFNRQVIERELGCDSVCIFPVSARLALEGKASDDPGVVEISNIAEFERALSTFLMNERGLVSLQSAVNGALKAAFDIRLGIELEHKAVQTPVEELETKLRLFNDRLSTVRKQKEEDLYLLEQVLNKLVVDTLDADLASLKTTQRTPLYERLRRMSEDSPGNAASVLRQMNERMPAMVQETLGIWQAGEAPKLSDTLNDRLQGFTDKINGLIDQVREISRDVFDLKLEHFSPDQKLSTYSGFFVRSWEVRVSFEFAAMPFLYIMPKSWTRKKLLHAAWERLWEQFDMHCGQMRYDFVQRLQSSIREYAKMLDAKIEDTADQIESAVRKAMEERSRGQVAVEAMLRQLDSELSMADRILQDLLSIRNRLPASANLQVSGKRREQ